MMTCALCGNNHYEVFEIPYAFLRHMDFVNSETRWSSVLIFFMSLVMASFTDKGIVSNEALG